MPKDQTTDFRVGYEYGGRDFVFHVKLPHNATTQYIREKLIWAADHNVDVLLTLGEDDWKQIQARRAM